MEMNPAPDLFEVELKVSFSLGACCLAAALTHGSGGLGLSLRASPGSQQLFFRFFKL